MAKKDAGNKMDDLEMAVLKSLSPRKHILERTSKKGDLFRGTCIKCGRENLSAIAAKDYCDGDKMPECNDVECFCGENCVVD